MEDHIGESYGTLTIIGREYDEVAHLTKYIVQCSVCGYIHSMRLSTIKKIKKRDRCYCSNAKENQLSNSRLTRTLNAMRSRCYNQNDKDYHHYGGRGIRVCDKWLQNRKAFENWATENGYQDNLTIDRIDPDGNYCPENCRWITREENARRAGKVNWFNLGGQMMTGKQIAQWFGTGINYINRYCRKHGYANTQEHIYDMLYHFCD